MGAVADRRDPVSAWEEAVTEFMASPNPILDALFPPDECDLAHADRAMLHGRNMVPDERWNGLSS